MEFIDLKHLGAGVVNIVNAGPTNCDTNGSENILLIISKLFLIHNDQKLTDLSKNIYLFSIVNCPWCAMQRILFI